MSHNRIADSLNNADLNRSAQAAFRVVTAMHDYRPGEQVAAAAAAFLFLCEHYRVSAQDAFTATTNMIHDAPRRGLPEFLAVQQYVKEEL